MASTMHSPVETGDEAGTQPVTPEFHLVPTIDAEIAVVEFIMKAVVENAHATPAQEAANYHLATGGGRMRARIAIASGIAWGTPQRHRIDAAAACELLHNASLVHDDLSDADAMRRGQPTIWHLYGSDIALCTGDLLLTSSFLTAANIDDAASSRALVRHLAEQASRVIGGQSVEVSARSGPADVSMAQYANATRAKTAPLFELPLLAGAIPDRMPADAARTLRTFAEAIGLAYQILDDLDDVPAQSERSEPPALHPLHAWHHHRPNPKGSISAHAIRHRCLRHAHAALARASSLTHGLPTPLRSELLALIHQLATKADRHSRSDLTAFEVS